MLAGHPTEHHEAHAPRGGAAAQAAAVLLQSREALTELWIAAAQPTERLAERAQDGLGLGVEGGARGRVAVRSGGEVGLGDELGDALKPGGHALVLRSESRGGAVGPVELVADGGVGEGWEVPAAGFGLEGVARVVHDFECGGAKRRVLSFCSTPLGRLSCGSAGLATCGVALEGGSVPGTGGSEWGTGGSVRGTGGSVRGTGGSMRVTGGSVRGTGGSVRVTGGSVRVTGGSARACRAGGRRRGRPETTPRRRSRGSMRRRGRGSR